MDAPDGRSALDCLFAGAGDAPLTWQADVAWLVRGGAELLVGAVEEAFPLAAAVAGAGLAVLAAGAAEVLAGALKDNGRATLIGADMRMAAAAG